MDLGARNAGPAQPQPGNAAAAEAEDHDREMELLERLSRAGRDSRGGRGGRTRDGAVRRDFGAVSAQRLPLPLTYFALLQFM